MSTQPGDSQKSLLSGMIGCIDGLLDSASDLVHATEAAEISLDHKRSGVLGSTGECLIITGDDSACSFGPSVVPSFDSDSFLHSFLEDDDAAAIRHLHPTNALIESNSFISPTWCREFPKRLNEAAWMTSDFSPGCLLHVSGPSTSTGMGGSRERQTTARGSSASTHEMPLLDVSTSSENPLTSPSHRTTVAESSIQTSARSDVDGYGFLFVDGEFERLSPFVHYDPPNDRRSVRRQAKWRVMLHNAEENWEEICRLHAKSIKKRVRKGIPKDWRYRVWPLLTGGRALQQENPGVYARFVRSWSQWEDEIKKDLDRTYPHHIFFMEQSGPGKEALFNCLKAYSLYDPEAAYVQSMGPVFGTLLLVMSEEDAFWTFAAMMREEPPSPRPTTAQNRIGCRRLYVEGFPLTQELKSKLMHLLGDKMPHLRRRIEAGIEDLPPADFTVSWWMALFCYVLPFQHVLRVWDVFMLEGWKMSLRVALAIMKCMESKLMEAEGAEALAVMQSSDVPRSLPQPDAFIKLALSMKISKSLKSWHETETE